MFTLHFPIVLPDERTYFEDARYVVPPLPGGYSVSSTETENHPFLLHISGFPSGEAAVSFGQVLTSVIRIATFETGHSMIPPSEAPTVSDGKSYDGSRPAVTLTEKRINPHFTSASMRVGAHLSELSKLIGSILQGGWPQKLLEQPALALALELYSSCQFAGQRNAQYIVLVTSLEVLAQKGSSGPNRNAVKNLARQILPKFGYTANSAGKIMDNLYSARNNLVHGGKSVSLDEFGQIFKVTGQILKGHFT